MIVLLVMIGPRFGLGFLWLTTQFVDRAFDGFILPLIGFLLAPWTTFTYVLVYDGNGVSLSGWLLVALAALADAASYAVSGRRGYEYSQFER